MSTEPTSHRIVTMVCLITCLSMCISGCARGRESGGASEDTEQISSVGRTTVERVTELADQVMRENGFNLSDYRREISEDSLRYYVRYSLVDTLSLGGGGTITISKKNLKVVKKIFEE